MSMLEWRVAPGGTDPEDTWVAPIFLIMAPSVSAARRLRVDFSDSFLTALEFLEWPSTLFCCLITEFLS